MSSKFLEYAHYIAQEVDITSQIVLNAETAAFIRNNYHGILNILLVFGTMRTAKSFLLNAIIGDSIFISQRGGLYGVTRGADIAFVSDPTGAINAFIDPEGSGENNYDVQLIAPLLLIAKVAIFNWSGPLRKDC